MGRSSPQELPRYGCLDALSSCFKKGPKTQSSTPDTPITPPTRVHHPKPILTQSAMPLPFISALGTHPSTTSNSPVSSEMPNEGEPSCHCRDQATPGVQQASNLWQEAFEGLDAECRKSISTSVSFQSDTSGEPAKQLIDLVEMRESQFQKDFAKIKIGEREVLWRDCATRVKSLLIMSVDVGIQFAPAPGTIVWSAVKVLLNTHTSGCESLVALFGCAERVLRLLNRGGVYEKVFLQVEPHDLQPCTQDLRESLVDAYRSALRLLDYANRQLKEGESVRRFFEALWDPKNAEAKLKELDDAERKVLDDAGVCKLEQGLAQGEEHKRLLRKLDEPLRYIDKKVAQVLTYMERHERLKILEFISPIHVGEQHERTTRDRTEGTGEWLFQREEFYEWENSPSSKILWLSGKVGAGKSVLTSSVIDRYWVTQINQDEEDTDGEDDNDNDKVDKKDEGFAFFYFSKNDKKLTDAPVTNVLRSLMRQLARVPHYPGRISRGLANRCQDMKEKGQTFLPERCRREISKLAKVLPRTIIVVDSLDEFETRDMYELVSFFVELVKNSERPVKVFLSSRQTTDIRDGLHEAGDHLEHVDIADQNQRDIEKYVRETAERHECRWKHDSVKDSVVKRISNDAQGMFRWAYLQMEQLIDLQSPEAVEARLGKLPHGLTEAYDELYDLTQSYDRIYLQRAVKWLLYAFDSLDTEQLLSAVQLSLVDDHDEPALNVRNRRLSEEALENICRHLIVKDDEDQWAFAHASVQEYFREHKDHSAWTNENAQIEVAKLSLLALIDNAKSLAVSGSLGSIVRIIDDGKTFEDYLAAYWMLHIKSLRHLPDEWKTISGVLRGFIISSTNPIYSSLEYQTWLEFTRRRGFSLGNDDVRIYTNDLMPAKNPAFGLIGLHLDLDTEEWARDCLQLHLEDVNDNGFDTLFLAARFGSLGFCRLLMDWGMDPNRALPNDASPLIEAIAKGNLECVKEFLERNADPNLDTMSRALCRATQRKCPELVRLLLRYGALPDALCRFCLFNCALRAAIHEDDESSAKVLIEAGANVNLNIQGKLELGTPLIAAAYSGRLGIAKLLIKHGADVNIRLGDSRFGGVLAAAFFCCRAEKMIHYLIEEAGADPHRLVEDLSNTAAPYIWRHKNTDDTIRKLGHYLFSKGYLDLHEMQGLEVIEGSPLKQLKDQREPANTYIYI